MGSDASKPMVIATKKGNSEKSGLSLRNPVARNVTTSTLVEKLLLNDFDQITPELIANEADQEVLLKLNDDAAPIWLLPMHVAVAQSSIPMDLLKALVRAYPEALMQHTRAPAGKPKSKGVGPEHEHFSDSIYSGEKSSSSDESSQQEPSLPWGVGWLPLHVMLWHNRGALEILEYLVEICPLALYCKTGQGLLPLHLAVWSTEEPPDLHSVQCLVMTFPASRYIPTSSPECMMTAFQLVQQTWESDESARAMFELLEGQNTPSKVLNRSHDLFLHNMPTVKNCKRWPLKRSTLDPTVKPTKLYLALSSRSWDDALAALERKPESSKIWTLTDKVVDPPCHMLPLHLAIRRKAPLSVIRGLLEAHPDAIAKREYFGMLPLSVACQSGAPLEIVRELWHAYPLAIREADISGLLPIHLACSSHALRMPVILFLLEHFPTGMTQKDGKGQVPLTYIQHSGHPHQQLLEAEFERGVAYWSATKPAEGTVARLLAKGKWQVTQDLIMERLESHPEEATKWVKIWGKRMLPIHLACAVHAPLSIVQEIAELHPDGLLVPCSDEHDMLPLHLACQVGGTPSVVEALMEACPEATAVSDAHGLLPLHVACSESVSSRVVEVLVDAYVDAIHVEDKKGFTPLVYAEATRHPHSLSIINAVSGGREHNDSRHQEEMVS